MLDTGERGRGRLVGGVIGAVLAIAAATLVAPQASAAPSAPTPKAGIAKSKRVAHYTPPKAAGRKPASQGGVTIQSGSSGAGSGDLTGDGAKDILARHQATGQLKIYPHSGTYNGTLTYVAPTTINYGWNGLRWIGQGKVVPANGAPRAVADVIGITPDGIMRVYPHSGTFNGTSTLTTPVVIVGYGWNINDLIFTYDIDGNGFDDLVARRQGTGDTYVYRHSGTYSGTSTFLAPEHVASGGETDLEQNMGDFNNDGNPDLMFLQADGWLSILSLGEGDINPDTGKPWGVAYALGYGWGTINAITLTDINRDNKVDVLGRRAADGVLQVYTNTGAWDPDPYGRDFGVLRQPIIVGYGWNINDVIS
ncbi:FG-GAP repeat domain-containing protein [Actinokineospora sp.]|uniref:FG-GAP repeat domain-containing protein n=1 Tax=Actinokineospora sp. TaxID=1872133 RepID=UPI003D6AEFD7